MLRRRVFVLRQGNLGFPDLAGVEPRIHGSERDEAVQQQAGAHQQDHSQRYFCHRQKIARTPPATSFARAPCCFPQAGLYSRIDGKKRRSQAEDNAGSDREQQRETEHAAVHSDHAKLRQTGRKEGNERFNAPIRQQDACQAPRQAEQYTFGEQLSNNAHPLGPQHDAHAYFPGACRGPSQQ